MWISLWEFWITMGLLVLAALAIVVLAWCHGRAKRDARRFRADNELIALYTGIHTSSAKTAEWRRYREYIVKGIRKRSYIDDFKAGTIYLHR